MAGWIKLHRNLINSAVFDNEKVLKVWVWCLFKATHKECEQLVGRQIVKLSKGQFITGRNAASTELKMKASTAWDYLKLLKKNESIDIKSNNRFSIITIVNWELYQTQDENSDSEYDSKSDNKSTTNQQQINTNKNVKNIKNVKNKEYISVFDFYMTLNLKKHRSYTNDMAKAIKKAVTDNKYEIEYCKELLKRHEMVVEKTKNMEYPVKARGFAEFFGQKVFGATHLICSEYEEGGKYYEQYIKQGTQNTRLGVPPSESVLGKRSEGWM